LSNCDINQPPANAIEQLDAELGFELPIWRESAGCAIRRRSDAFDPAARAFISAQARLA
jgi:hypothetical protein